MKQKSQQQQKQPLEEQIEKARGLSRKRKFQSRFDLIINVRGIDLRKPENRFSFDLNLPGGRYKTPKAAFIADNLAKEVSGFGEVIKKDQIEALGKNKKQLKKIVDSNDMFFAEPSLMALVGKSMGTVLGPRGKMPKPLPPGANLENFLKTTLNNIKVSLKESPLIQVTVGSEDMPNEKVAANIRAIYNTIKDKLPKGETNIKSVVLKLTMGKPMKIEV